jgi:Beta-galactosidase
VRTLKTTSTIALALVAIAISAAPAGAVPRSFFGIAPQTALGPEDTSRMRQARVGAIRVPVVWSSVQPRPRAEYNWTGLDETVEVAARDGISVFPFIYGAPRWLGKPTRLPVDSARARNAWSAFLTAAVERYGPRGEFWSEHSSGGDFVPRTPIRSWQIWNEENFFYFTRPASPGRYARLLKVSHRAIRQADRGAKTIAGGLFGNPRQRPPAAMKATEFLERLYRVRGARSWFDGIALHPYVPDVPSLRTEVEALRRVAVRNRDAGVGLYLTEMGWGSARPNRQASFELGLRGQAQALTDAYRYLIPNRRRLNLKQVFWFSWKDAPGCNFCDSAGLFRRGGKFRPKPAWRAFRRAAR